MGLADLGPTPSPPWLLRAGTTFARLVGIVLLLPVACHPAGTPVAAFVLAGVAWAGAILAQTIRLRRVIEASYQDFADAAAAAIAAGAFNPARVGACPVKSLVQQRIRFTVR